MTQGVAHLLGKGTQLRHIGFELFPQDFTQDLGADPMTCERNSNEELLVRVNHYIQVFTLPEKRSLRRLFLNMSLNQTLQDLNVLQAPDPLTHGSNAACHWNDLEPEVACEKTKNNKHIIFSKFPL